MTDADKADFLERSQAAALKADHIWPPYAACETALESGWGQSALAKRANNLFGQKQGKKIPLPYPCIDMNTEEVYPSGRVVVCATWLVFPDWETCFRERMALLRRLPKYYGNALAAQTGEGFVKLVSLTWATDPHRAEKVLAIHRQFFGGPRFNNPELLGES